MNKNWYGCTFYEYDRHRFVFALEQDEAHRQQIRLNCCTAALSGVQSCLIVDDDLTEVERLARGIAAQRAQARLWESMGFFARAFEVWREAKDDERRLVKVRRKAKDDARHLAKLRGGVL